MPPTVQSEDRLEIFQFPCLNDNYGYLIHAGGETAAIDSPDVDAILAALKVKGWRLTHILNTHHHPDHAGGNLALKAKTGCRIVGPRAEAPRIPGLDEAVGDGEDVTLGGRHARVFDVPGHTAGHIAYWFKDDGAAFVGDTLFALGCGRVFEGTPAQMWASLQKLRGLPDDTRVYCAHEYTQKNAQFALTVEPHNADLRRRAADIDAKRARNEPTVPSTIGLEKATNPFFRPESADLQATLGLAGADLVEVFAETRRRKDKF